MFDFLTQMIIEKKSLIKLRDFGLNTYESKIWTALLSRGVSTAGELSDIANVPRSRSYDVLESLEKKGFVDMKLGKPIKYIAIPPKEVLETVKKKTEDRTRIQISNLDSLKSSKTIKELDNIYEGATSLHNPNGISGSLNGRINLYRHLESMLKKSKKSVILVTNESRFEEKSRLFDNLFENLIKKGVDVKIALNSNKSLKSNLNKSLQIRKIDINIRFCLVDGKETLFMLFDDEKVHPNYDVGIWVVSTNLCKNIEKIFNNIWEKSEFYN